MHPDRKIGIAMGILLVGVVAALFFRNEPLAVEEGLSTRREAELNQRLRDRDVAVYLEPETESTAVDADDSPPWTLTELFEQADRADEVPLPIGLRAPIAEPEPTALDKEAVVRTPPFAPPTLDSNTSQANEPTAFVQADSMPTEPKSAANQPLYDEYKVQFGDTLSEISERFLGSQTRYREIFEMNRDRMESPDRLKVGRAIRVPRVLR